MLRDAPNIQSLWGDLIVEELVRNEVGHFVVCPGSRSTPLVQAAVRHPDAEVTLWVDERGAAFHALGRSRGGACAHAVITTSGTAVANLLPAVVEASLEGVPLVLLTADRPPELREVGANQSIRQVGLFSDHVRWALDLPAPGVDMPARALLSAVDAAVHAAQGGHPGPVHLNCPFREPLAPTVEPWDAAWLADLDAWLGADQPLMQFRECDGLLADDPLEELLTAIRSAERGLLVCGAMDVLDEGCVRLLAAQLRWPLWADIRSGMRLGATDAPRCVHMDRILDAGKIPPPDMVLQFGGRLTSKRMQSFLDGGVPNYTLVDPEPSRLDPGHRVTHRLVGSIGSICLALGEALAEDGPAAELASLHTLEACIETALEEAVEDGDALSEPYVARWLSRHMQEDYGLFLSSSMPIRDMQAFAAPEGPRLQIAANRGASGIDGVVSTAAGWAQWQGLGATLLVGDLALLHDVNALSMLKGLEKPLVVVVLNNGGGSIFSFLPIAEHADVLAPLVNTPHAITFDGVCASFDIPHTHVADRPSFETAYEEAVRAGVPWVIEVDSSLAGNKAEHDRIEAAIRTALEPA